MSKKHDKHDSEHSHDHHDKKHGHKHHHADEGDSNLAPENDQNPPRTSSGWLTTPKFGSSTSGGGEIEPGPEKD